MVDDAALEAGKSLDLQTCALVLTELFATGLSSNSSSSSSSNSNSGGSSGLGGVGEEGDGNAAAGAQKLDQAALQRLLFDVFQQDVLQFREYCLQVWVKRL